MEYRISFLIGRSRHVFSMLILYFLWKTLAVDGNFAGYSGDELVLYVILSNLIQSIIFGFQSKSMPQEMNDGTFTMYLVKPVSHFLYNFFLELAQKILNLFSSIIEVGIFIFILKINLNIHFDWHFLLFFLLSMFLAVILYSLMIYFVNLIAFWSREAMGPRFLFDWILGLTSGSYFPIDILTRKIFILLNFLPFAYIVYFPIEIILGRLNYPDITRIVGIQFMWMLLFGFLVLITWRKGLKKYSGEGI